MEKSTLPVDDVGKHRPMAEEVEASTTADPSPCRQVASAEAFDDLDLSNTLASKPDDSDGRTEWSWLKALAAVSLSGFYVAGSIPTLLIGSCLKYIAEDLDAEFASWLITANTLVVAATTPFLGYLTDLLGPRYIVLFGSASLMVGITITGTAHSFGQAVAGMAMAGLGGGICDVNAISGISELAPVRLRGRFIGMITLLMVFFHVYPFYTQELCRNATWRWVCWIIVIWTGIWWVVCLLTYFPDSRRHRIEGLTKMGILRRLDWVGAATSSAGVALLLVGLQDGGYRYAWNSAHVIATLVVGFILVAAFVVWETWFAPHPMIPRVLFKIKGVVLPLTLAFTAGVTYFAALAFSPLLLQNLYYTKSPTQIAVLTYGFSLGLWWGSIAGSTLISYCRGNVRWPMLISSAIMMAFTGAFMASDPNNPAFTAAIATFCAFGIGGVLVGSASIAITCSPDSLIATVAGLTMSVRTLGGAVGTTIYTAIYANKLGKFLPTEVATYAIEAGLPVTSAPAFVEAFLTGKNTTTMPHVTPKIVASAALGEAWANARAFKYVWATSVAFGGVACIVASLLPNTVEYMTNRVAVDYAGPKGGRKNGELEVKGEGTIIA